MESQIISSPWIQGGFAVFCCVQTAIIVWLIRQLLDVIRKSNDVNERLTDVISKANDNGAKTLTMFTDIRDRLLSRPCLKDRT